MVFLQKSHETKNVTMAFHSGLLGSFPLNAVVGVFVVESGDQSAEFGFAYDFETKEKACEVT